MNCVILTVLFWKMTPYVCEFIHILRYKTTHSFKLCTFSGFIIHSFWTTFSSLHFYISSLQCSFYSTLTVNMMSSMIEVPQIKSGMECDRSKSIIHCWTQFCKLVNMNGFRLVIIWTIDWLIDTSTFNVGRYLFVKIVEISSWITQFQLRFKFVRSRLKF